MDKEKIIEQSKNIFKKNWKIILVISIIVFIFFIIIGIFVNKPTKESYALQSRYSTDIKNIYINALQKKNQNGLDVINIANNSVINPNKKDSTPKESKHQSKNENNKFPKDFLNKNKTKK